MSPVFDSDDKIGCVDFLILQHSDRAGVIRSKTSANFANPFFPKPIPNFRHRLAQFQIVNISSLAPNPLKFRCF